MDPTGDIPWEEEPTAGDVVHVESPEVCVELEVEVGLGIQQEISCWKRNQLLYMLII